MTDDLPKADVDTRLFAVLERNDIPTDNIQLHERQPSPQDDKRYAIRVMKDDGSHAVAWESPWYTEDQFRTYLHGIEHAQEIAWQVANND